MEAIPCDLGSPGLKGLELSEGKGQNYHRGKRNTRGKKLQRIRGGKARSESRKGKRFSLGDLRKLATRRQARTRREFGTLPSPCSWCREQLAALGA